MTALSAFIDNIIELLLGFIITFNVSAYSLLWRKVSYVEKETDKNSETLNMVLNRIFGIDEDPTDDGYIMESENRFDNMTEKLERIAEKQDEACESRERLERNVNIIVNSLDKNDDVSFDESKLND